MYRYCFFLLFLLSPSFGIAFDQGPFDQTHSSFTLLLGQRVDVSGMVDYPALKNDPKLLDAYLSDLAAVSNKAFASWSQAEQIAFLINLYNACTLKLVIDHYPVKSIKDIGGFFGSPWKKKVVPLFGEKVTLDHIEHEILRTQYKEPRIHFALVCAAKSCPPLRQEAYRGADLEEQLTSQAKRFLAQPKKNRLDSSNNILYLSKIFSWFKKDFLHVSPSVVKFLQPYLTKETLTYLSKHAASIRYTSYNWSLNKQE